MAQPYADRSHVPPSMPRKRMGCWAWGWLAVIVFFVLLIIGILLAAGKLTSILMNKYTSDAPMPVPAFMVSPEQIEAVKTRIEAFKKAVDEGKRVQLILTGDDVNTLLHASPDWKPAGAKLYAVIEEDTIRALASIPLDDLNIPLLRSRLKGRYLNGNLAIKVALQFGILVVMLDHIEVAGKPFPEQFMKEIRKSNLAQEVNADTEFAALVRKLESAGVVRDRIVITSK